MDVNTTAWNRIRYSLAAPFYNALIAPLQALGFAHARRRALALLDPQPGSRLLMIGAGTGMDLDYIPADVEVVATDLSPRMIEELTRRAERLERKVDAQVMDGESLSLADQEFDHVVLHLVLAIMPDPYACAREVGRVLKPGGTVSIFDKFVPDGEEPSMVRRALNVFTEAIFSDVTRQLGPILEAGELELQHEEKTFLDFFTIAIAEKPENV